MRSFLKVLLKIVEVIVILYVIFMSTFLLCRNKYGYTQFGENTLVSVKNKDTKYLDEFKKNTLVIFKEVDCEDINVGDKLYYYAVENEKYVIKVGKVVEKDGEASDSLYKFEGMKDVAISGSKIIGTYSKQYKDIGGILLFISSRVGFLLFVLLPILILFIYEIYDLVVTVKYDNNDEGSSKKKSIKKEEEIETL